MFAKKLAVLVAAAAVSAPAFADRGNHYGHGHRFDHRPHYRVVHRPIVHRPIVHRPVVHHYYRPAPRPVVVVQRPHDGAALLVGAILGAAIVHHVTMGY